MHSAPGDPWRELEGELFEITAAARAAVATQAQTCDPSSSASAGVLPEPVGMPSSLTPGGSSHGPAERPPRGQTVTSPAGHAASGFEMEAAVGNTVSHMHSQLGDANGARGLHKQEKCANPTCQFLVHSQLRAEMGPFCCHMCRCRVTENMPSRNHGPQCQRRFAPENARTAVFIPSAAELQPIVQRVRSAFAAVRAAAFPNEQLSMRDEQCEVEGPLALQKVRSAPHAACSSGGDGYPNSVSPPSPWSSHE